MQAQIKSICLISMLAGIISAVIPSGKMKSAFTSFCAVAVIFYILTPLTDIEPDIIKFSAFESEKKEEALLSDIRSAEVMLYEQMLERALVEKLHKAGFDVSLKIICEKCDDEIRTVSVSVEGCSGEENRKSVERFLVESLGDINVSFKEEKNE